MSKNTNAIKGILPPVITVFDSQGEIDEEKTTRFIQNLIDRGVDGVCVGGSTGEAPLMSTQQRKQLIEIGVKAVGGKLPLIAGTGHNSTRITIELSKHAESTGADVVFIALPHYPKATQESIYMHYKAIAQEINIPIWIYNWPGQYGVDVTPETVTLLAKEGYIQGIKDSHDDISHTAEIIRLTNCSISVFSGFENKILPALSIGASGSISTATNILPEEIISIYDSFQKGDFVEAKAKQLTIYGVIKVLETRHDTQLLKEGIKMLGFDVGNALMPTSELPEALKESLRIELTKLGKLN